VASLSVETLLVLTSRLLGRNRSVAGNTFVGTNPTDESMTSGLPVCRQPGAMSVPRKHGAENASLVRRIPQSITTPKDKVDRVHARG
jgi:hypothetical protein